MGAYHSPIISFLVSSHDFEHFNVVFIIVIIVSIIVFYCCLHSLSPFVLLSLLSSPSVISIVVSHHPSLSSLSPPVLIMIHIPIGTNPTVVLDTVSQTQTQIRLLCIFIKWRPLKIMAWPKISFFYLSCLGAPNKGTSHGAGTPDGWCLP